MSWRHVEANLARVRGEIAEAALRAGRRPGDVSLVAVSKSFPAEAVVAAFQAGQRHFGENRVEEAQVKLPAVREALSAACGEEAGRAPIWHMIGHIQSRKAEAVASTFDRVHAVERLKVAERLSRFARAAGRTLPVLLECNVSGEESKFGFDLDNWQEDADRQAAFFDSVEPILALPALDVRGLMTMAPVVDEPEMVRPIFAALRSLRDALRERFPTHTWPELSMGMSDDFSVAVEEGATWVRIGRAIFGPRTAGEEAV